MSKKRGGVWGVSKMYEARWEISSFTHTVDDTERERVRERDELLVYSKERSYTDSCAVYRADVN